MATQPCAADDCNIEFEPTDWRQIYHSARCASRMRVKRMRQKRRGGNGGGGGGGNGGGGVEPTLFDTITPQDSRSVYVPDTCYRTPEQEAPRKPSTRAAQKSNKAAA